MNILSWGENFYIEKKSDLHFENTDCDLGRVTNCFDGSFFVFFFSTYNVGGYNLEADACGCLQIFIPYSL
jgi:hypothetical protein